MKKNHSILVLLFVFILIIAVSSCSKKRSLIAFDFHEKHASAHKTVPKTDYDLFKEWDITLRWNGWRRNKDIEKGAILFPETQNSTFLTFGVITKDRRTIHLKLKPLLLNKRKPVLDLEFFVNGIKISDLSLSKSEYVPFGFEVGEDQLLIGENTLEIRVVQDGDFKSDRFWLALKDFRIFESIPTVNHNPLPAEEQFSAEVQKSLFSKKKILRQGINTSLDYYLKIPQNGRLLFDFSFEETENLDPQGKEFYIYLETETGRKDKIFSQVLDLNGEKSSASIDLSKFQNEIAKISFCFNGSSSVSDSRAELVLWEPRLIENPSKIKSEEDFVQSEELDEPFNILIYLVDCLRPDHLPFYGYEKNTAPHMTEMAQDSIVFNNSYSQSSWTRPSVGALFTGLHPFQHLAITLKSGLSTKLETMAEFLKRAGYFTTGFSSNAGIKEYFNFHQGFENFKYHGKQGGGVAEKLNEYIFPELEKIRTPFFMYVHTMDVHRPYFLKEEFIPPPKDDPVYADSLIIQVNKEKKNIAYEVVLDYSLAQYDAAIKQNDQSFGELIHHLKKLDLYDDTMIILISDHGEEFYDHGKFAHGSSLYQEVIHNVLAIKMPGQIMAGKIIEEKVQEIDLLPTILELTKQNIPVYLAGRSLKNMLISDYVPKNPLHDALFFEACADLRKKAMISGDWKIIHTGRQWKDSPFGWELYDLKEDPLEKNNLANINIIASQYLKDKLQSWALAQEKLKTLGREDVEKTLTEEDIEEFRALGYIR